MYFTRFFKAVKDGNPAAIATVVAPLAMPGFGFVVPIVAIGGALTADVAVGTGKAISDARKRRADRMEKDRQRRHEIQMQREQIAHQERVEAAKPKPKSKREQAEELQIILDAVLNGLRHAPMDEDSRQALINMKIEEFSEKLGRLLR